MDSTTREVIEQVMSPARRQLSVVENPHDFTQFGHKVQDAFEQLITEHSRVEKVNQAMRLGTFLTQKS